MPKISKPKDSEDNIKKQCFAARLKFLRENANLTQHEISDLLGLKQPAYARYENGTFMPRIDILKAIANVLEVAPEYLLYGDKIGFTYDEDKDIYTSFTLTIPKNELNVDKEKALSTIDACKETFDDNDLSLLYHCGKAIKLKNVINEKKKEYNIESSRIDTIISDTPIKPLED